MVFEIAGIHEIQALVDPHGEHLGAGDYRVPQDVAVMLRPGYPADDGDVRPACAPEIEEDGHSDAQRDGRLAAEDAHAGCGRDEPRTVGRAVTPGSPRPRQVDKAKARHEERTA